MRHATLIAILGFGVFLVAGAGSLLLLDGCAGPGPSSYLPGAEGDYLGFAPPGETMEIFAPGVLTFGTHEHHLSLTSDGREIFFVVADRLRRHHTIIRVLREGDRWLRPEVAPFSGVFNDFAPTPHPDGSSLLFCSNRSLSGDSTETGNVNIWVVDRTAEGWGDPFPLPGRVNDESAEYNPTLAMDGTLYFQDFDGESAEIYRASPTESGYGVPEKVEEVGSSYPEIGPLVTPDGKTLVFSSSRSGGEGDLDFWVSFLDEGGRWSEPVNLGSEINTPAADAIITLSPDGRYFFFTNFLAPDPERLQGLPYPDLIRVLDGPENGDGTVYWISTSILEKAHRVR